MGWREIDFPRFFVKERPKTRAMMPRVEPTLEMPKVRKPKPRNAQHFREVAVQHAEDYMYAHGIMEAIYNAAKEGKVELHLALKNFEGTTLEEVRQACKLLGFRERAVGNSTSVKSQWVHIVW